MSIERHNTTFEVEGGIAVLTIDRPKALNALNEATLNELDATITECAKDDTIRALIITGGGNKAFVAGADISNFPKMDPEQAAAFSMFGSGIFARLEALDIPVVAAVNGFALGGGCELMLACDFAYASENAKFGQPEVKLGIIAGYGGTQRLPRKIGYGPAMELLMNGEMIGADEAFRLGLVNKVVPTDDLLDTARAAVSVILKRGPLAVAATKRAIVEGLSQPLTDGLHTESAAFGEVFKTADAKEGAAAFLEKRKPKFQGK